MKAMKKAKNIYDAVEIPSELEQMVIQTLQIYNKQLSRDGMYDFNKKRQRSVSGRKIAVWTGMAAGVAFGVMVTGLNTSPVFASAMQKNIVFGPLAKVFTFRTYEQTDRDKSVYEKIPGVSVEEADVKDTQLAAEVNKKIQEHCDNYVKEAVKRVKEYKEAFLKTGGTEAEFEKKNIQIHVDYELLSQTDSILSFIVRGTESWVSAYAMTEYYNLDLDSFEDLTLKDLLGENYISIANHSICEQIKKREEQDPSAEFFAEADGGFQGIDDTTNFYVNADGNPVIVFDKYQIAPGYMGQLEFEINRDETEAETETVQTAQQEVDTSQSRVDFAQKIRQAFQEKSMEEQADFSSLEETGAGITIGDGVPCITFAENQDGSFGITGINYAP